MLFLPLLLSVAQSSADNIIGSNLIFVESSVPRELPERPEEQGEQSSASSCKKWQSFQEIILIGTDCLPPGASGGSPDLVLFIIEGSSPLRWKQPSIVQ